MIKEKIKKAWNWIKKQAEKLVVILGLGTAIALAAGETNLLQSNDLNYPLLVNTDLEKLEYSERAEELLRLEHNAKGQDFLNGIIAEKDWDTYLETDFNPKSKAIDYEEAILREKFNLTDFSSVSSSTEATIDVQKMKEATKYDSDIDLNTILK